MTFYHLSFYHDFLSSLSSLQYSLYHDANLQGALSADTVYMELLQVIGRDKQDVIQIETQEAGDKPNVVVATFETSALELLFPFPQLLATFECLCYAMTSEACFYSPNLVTLSTSLSLEHDLAS